MVCRQCFPIRWLGLDQLAFITQQSSTVVDGSKKVFQLDLGGARPIARVVLERQFAVRLFDCWLIRIFLDSQHVIMTTNDGSGRSAVCPWSLARLDGVERFRGCDCGRPW
jgi:hypothetical protein